MQTYDNILDAIGDTPLVRLRRLVEPGWADVFVKCEYMNPAGSITDRMAAYIIRKAEQEGLLKPGGTIVENTSGNTGMGAAMTAAADDLAHDAWQHFSALTAIAGVASEAQDVPLLARTIAQLETLIAQHPGEPIFRHDLSGFLFNLGRDDDAKREIAAAAELGAENAYLASLAAQVHARLGDPDGAASWNEEAAARNQANAARLITPAP